MQKNIASNRYILRVTQQLLRFDIIPYFALNAPVAVGACGPWQCWGCNKNVVQIARFMIPIIKNDKISKLFKDFNIKMG